MVSRSIFRYKHGAQCGAILPSTDISGNDIEDKPAASAALCCTLCLRVPACAAAVWVSDQSKCYLKTTGYVTDSAAAGTWVVTRRPTSPPSSKLELTFNVGTMNALINCENAVAAASGPSIIATWISGVNKYTKETRLPMGVALSSDGLITVTKGVGGGADTALWAESPGIEKGKTKLLAVALGDTDPSLGESIGSTIVTLAFDGLEHCIDSPDGWVSSTGNTCTQYMERKWCMPDGTYGTGWSHGRFADWAFGGKDASQACCVCGGGVGGAKGGCSFITEGTAAGAATVDVTFLDGQKVGMPAVSIKCTQDFSAATRILAVQKSGTNPYKSFEGPIMNVFTDNSGSCGACTVYNNVTSTCDHCGSGSFCAPASGNICLKCYEGTSQPVLTSAAACTPCIAGKYSDQTGQPTCKEFTDPSCNKGEGLASGTERATTIVQHASAGDTATRQARRPARATQTYRVLSDTSPGSSSRQDPTMWCVHPASPVSSRLLQAPPSARRTH